MLTITLHDNKSKFLHKASFIDTFRTLLLLYLFGYKKVKFDLIIPHRVYFVVHTGFEPAVELFFFFITSDPPIGCVYRFHQKTICCSGGSRTPTLLIQSQACYQLHHGTVFVSNIYYISDSLG